LESRDARSALPVLASGYCNAYSAGLVVALVAGLDKLATEACLEISANVVSLSMVPSLKLYRVSNLRQTNTNYNQLHCPEHKNAMSLSIVGF